MSQSIRKLQARPAGRDGRGAPGCHVAEPDTPVSRSALVVGGASSSALCCSRNWRGPRKAGLARSRRADPSDRQGRTAGRYSQAYGEVDGDFGRRLQPRRGRAPAPDAEYLRRMSRARRTSAGFCRERAIKTIVFASSISTYGPGEPEDRSSQLSPSRATASQTIAERIHREWLDAAPIIA